MTQLAAPRFDSLIFDLDGTLWDASPTTALAWSEVAQRLGIPVVIDEQSIKGVSGLPFDDCVDARFGKYAKQVPNLYSQLDLAEREAIIAKGGRIYPGVIDGIKSLHKRYKLFLVSNCQDWYLKSFLSHSELGPYFQDTLCFGQTGVSKRENIEQIILRNGLNKPIYVGDTHWDQAAAYLAGAKFIFAKFGFGKIPIASPFVNSFAELVQFMLGSLKQPDVTVRALASSEYQQATDYYLAVGYVQKTQPEDLFFGAFSNGKLVGLVRLANEEGVQVLRGMQILPQYQLFGVGTRLLKILEPSISSERCFCLPHGWLTDFYGQIGFRRVVDLEKVPEFLLRRHQTNQAKYPDLIMMER